MDDCYYLTNWFYVKNRGTSGSVVVDIVVEKGNS